MMNLRVYPKLGIYYSHYECFGHTSRVMAVGEIFKKRFPHGNLFFIQGGVKQPQARIDQMGKIYSLPGILTDRRHFKEPVRGAGADAGNRSDRCLDIITQESPNLFITEFFPLGRGECRYELIPSLIKASAKGAAIWAVAGYPLLIGVSHEWREKVLALYEKIIILAPVQEMLLIANAFTRAEDKRKYLEFFHRNAEKIVFAGYLLPQQEVVRDDEDENRPKPPVPTDVCRVTVVRGGGAFYPKLIAEAIRASDLLGKEYYFTVVAGPATTSQEWYFFDTLIGRKKVNNLVLRRAVGNYEELMAKSDVCVSVASYHSSVILLKYQKKAVIIPFHGDGKMTFCEQPARATMLKERLGAKILTVEELTAHHLAASVKEAAKEKNTFSPIPQDWFNGEDVLDRELTRLLQHS